MGDRLNEFGFGHAVLARQGEVRTKLIRAL
jgi:hypothetical protein